MMHRPQQTLDLIGLDLIGEVGCEILSSVDDHLHVLAVPEIGIGDERRDQNNSNSNAILTA
jgi:hypothetical protein